MAELIASSALFLPSIPVVCAPMEMSKLAVFSFQIYVYFAFWFPPGKKSSRNL